MTVHMNSSHTYVSSVYNLLAGLKRWPCLYDEEIVPSKWKK